MTANTNPVALRRQQLQPCRQFVHFGRAASPESEGQNRAAPQFCWFTRRTCRSSGAPRIHGEILKLGVDVGQTSVAKYMARRRGPPSQGDPTAERIANQLTEACDWEQIPRYLIRDRDGA